VGCQNKSWLLLQTSNYEWATALSILVIILYFSIALRGARRAGALLPLFFQKGGKGDGANFSSQYHREFKDSKATIVTATLASHNLPTNRARELIKPSTDSASLRLEIEKIFFRLGFWVLCVLRHNESMFGQF